MRVWLLAACAVLTLRAQPGVQRFTLPNGLRVLLLEDHERPLVRARLQVRYEPGDGLPDRPGLARLLLQMMARSAAADLGAEDLDRFLEGSGIQLTQWAGREGLEWCLVARGRDQDRAFNLLADRLFRTLLEPSLLEAQRQACARPPDPAGSPPPGWDGEPAAAPSLAQLRTISLEDLLDFRARVLRPDRAVLAIQGDLGLEQAKRMLLLSLGSWVARPPSQGPAAPPPPAGPAVRAPRSGPGTCAVADRPEGLAEEAAALLSLLLAGDPALAPIRVTRAGRRLAFETEAGSRAELLERLGDRRRSGYAQADLDRARTIWLARRSLSALHPWSPLEAALAEASGRGIADDRLKALPLEVLNAGLRLWLDPARLRFDGD